MAFELQANRVVIGAALLAASSVASVQAATLADPAVAGLQTAPQPAADSIETAEREQGKARRERLRKELIEQAKKERERTRDPKQADRLQKMADENPAELAVGVLYAAVPGAALALGDAMIETAMGPNRSAADGNKAVWGRMSIAGARPVVATGLKSPFGPITKDSRLQANTLAAQFGTPVYRNATTRLDATFGFGARMTQFSPSRKKDAELKTYSASIGAILQHRAPAEIDLRLGAQLSGGGSILKAPGVDRKGKDLEERFKHMGVGLRAEASRDFAMGRGVVITPLLGLGASTAWVRQAKDQSTNNTALSGWVSTRLAYHHAMQSGRSAAFWVEPTYIGQIKRTNKLTAQFKGVDLDVTSRSPRDRVGVRLGMDMPVGKQASVQVGLSRFWGVGSSRQKDGALNLGYLHSF